MSSNFGNDWKIGNNWKYVSDWWIGNFSVSLCFELRRQDLKSERQPKVKAIISKNEYWKIRLYIKMLWKRSLGNSMKSRRLQMEKQKMNDSKQFCWSTISKKFRSRLLHYFLMIFWGRIQKIFSSLWSLLLHSFQTVLLRYVLQNFSLAPLATFTLHYEDFTKMFDVKKNRKSILKKEKHFENFWSMRKTIKSVLGKQTLFPCTDGRAHILHVAVATILMEDRIG